MNTECPLVWGKGFISRSSQWYNKMVMKITYDKRADALNIVLKNGVVKKTVEISPEIFVDMDKNGVPLYLEIIGVGEKIGEENFNNLTIGSKNIPLPSFA